MAGNSRIDPGEHLAVVGPTGAGKSTLAKLAAGLLVPTAGTVTLAGRDLGELTADERRRRSVLLPNTAMSSPVPWQTTCGSY